MLKFLFKTAVVVGAAGLLLEGLKKLEESSVKTAADTEPDYEPLERPDNMPETDMSRYTASAPSSEEDNSKPEASAEDASVETESAADQPAENEEADEEPPHADESDAAVLDTDTEDTDEACGE